MIVSRLRHIERILDALVEARESLTVTQLARSAAYASCAALQYHLRPLVADGRVLVSGQGRSLRYSPSPRVRASRAYVRPAPFCAPRVALRDTEHLMVVWDGSRGSASLTGEASGLGSSLGGVSYEIGRRAR
jgi:hypothetical protein